jgi:iron complex transport system ATP-binding protein
MTGITATDVVVKVKGTALLHGVDLDVRSGEWLSIIGPNGAGKSTLLRAIGGAMKATGRIRIGDDELGSLSGRERAQRVAWVPQSPVVPPGMKVLDYVLLGRTAHLHPLATEGSSDVDVVESILTDLDLHPLAHRHVSTLSGGERQRTVIARALAQQTTVLLLDEPTTALDLGHQQEVLSLLWNRHQQCGLTIVSTMHDLTLAGSFADRLILLADGRVAAEGTAADVLTERNIETHYGARVTVRQEGGTVLVLPRIEPPKHPEPKPDTPESETNEENPR